MYFRNRICEFLESIFEVIISYFEGYDHLTELSINSNSEQSKKMKKITGIHRFLVDISRAIKVFNDCHLQSYLLTFVSTVNSYIEDIDPSASEKESLTLFFLTFFIESTLQIMNKK